MGRICLGGSSFFRFFVVGSVLCGHGPFFPLLNRLHIIVVYAAFPRKLYFSCLARQVVLGVCIVLLLF